MSGPRTAAPAVLAALSSELEARGFRREGTAAVYLRPVTEEVDSWVGLNSGTRPTGAVVLNPVIGVRHLFIEADVARFTGATASTPPPPTVRAPLAHWDAKMASPTFDDARGWRAVRRLRAVAAAIDDAARRLAEAASSLEGLAGALSDPWLSVGDEGAIRRAVALARLGRDREADELADRLLADVQGRADPAAERVAGFVERFRSRRRPGS